MKALTFAIAMALASTAHAGWGDGLDALFSDIPVQWDPEPADADFDFSNWLEAGDFTLAPDEPVVLVSSEARAAAVEPPAEGPVANDGGLCRGVARIEDAQRERETRRYVREVLRAGKIKDAGQRIEDCMKRYSDSLTTDLRIRCLDLTPTTATAQVLLNGFRQDFTAALGQCMTVGTLSDKQIVDAYSELLRR